MGHRRIPKLLRIAKKGAGKKPQERQKLLPLNASTYDLRVPFGALVGSSGSYWRFGQKIEKVVGTTISCQVFFVVAFLVLFCFVRGRSFNVVR